jgi:DNA invertase Pin-like site-specific DNA recombinase
MEQVSSVAQREQLQLALDYVRASDTLVVTKLDRLAICWRLSPRSKPKGRPPGAVHVRQPELDTSTATGVLMLAVIGPVGQAKRETMLEPQREGIAKAEHVAARCVGPTRRRWAALPSLGSRKRNYCVGVTVTSTCRSLLVLTFSTVNESLPVNVGAGL